jgi:hypothetical protein
MINIPNSDARQGKSGQPDALRSQASPIHRGMYLRARMLAGTHAAGPFRGANVVLECCGHLHAGWWCTPLCGAAHQVFWRAPSDWELQNDPSLIPRVDCIKQTPSEGEPRRGLRGWREARGELDEPVLGVTPRTAPSSKRHAVQPASSNDVQLRIALPIELSGAS